MATVEVAGRIAHFWEEGRGDPVLYLHGFPTSGFLWREVIAEVSTGFRTIAPDFPGFGRSDLLRGPHTWERLVDWVGEFVDAIGLEEFHLAVHDWGGLIGLAWACKNPGRISSLFITDTSFRAADEWHGLAQQWRAPDTGEQMIGEMAEEGFSNFIRAVSQFDDESVAEFWKGLDTRDRRMAKLEMYRSLEFEMFAPLEPLLPKVAPSKVEMVWGGLDPVLPVRTAERLGDALGCEPKVIEEAGHFLQNDQGPLVGRLHRDFLESLN